MNSRRLTASAADAQDKASYRIKLAHRKGLVGTAAAQLQCRRRVISGQTIADQKRTFVRYGPKADKRLPAIGATIKKMPATGTRGGAVAGRARPTGKANEAPHGFPTCPPPTPEMLVWPRGLSGLLHAALADWQRPPRGSLPREGKRARPVQVARAIGVTRVTARRRRSPVLAAHFATAQARGGRLPRC